jgi:hypothetical protein
MSASKPKTPQSPPEDSLDEALEETFPASDPIAVEPSPAGSRPPSKSSDESHKKGDTHRHGKH